MAGEEPIAAESPGEAPKASDPAAKAERQFREEVLPEELRYVRDRRASHGIAPDPPESLVGLALSGGGIRSATFNLGVLQAFDRHGLFKHFDYLSTVSGGGFLGSSLTALLSEDARKGSSRPGVDGESDAVDLEGRRAAAFPFQHSDGADEEDTVKYLRGHSDYLAPQGLTDYLRAFALLSRGIALNLGLLLPILLIVSLLGMVFSIDDLMSAARRDAWMESLETRLFFQYGEEEPGEETPLEPALEVLTGAASPYGLEVESVLAALREEAPLIRRARTGGRPFRFEGATSWKQVAERVASLDEARREQRLLALGLEKGSPAEAVTYRHAGGVRLYSFDRRAFETLWSDSSPIAAAAISPDRRHIVGAGHDGALWVWWPQAGVDGIERNSGRFYRRDGPWQSVAFSTDGSFLIATTPDQRVFAWRARLVIPEGQQLFRPFERLLPELVPAGDGGGPECGGCRIELDMLSAALDRGAEPRRSVVGLAATAIELDAPRTLPPVAPPRVEADPAPAWSPRSLRLPLTGRALVAILLLFVALYPVSVVLAGPLDRLAAGVASALRGIARLRRRRKSKAKAKGEPGRSKGVAAAWRIAGSALLASPLFGWSTVLLEGLPQVHQSAVFPFVGFAWMALWGILCMVFLVPVLRRWRPRAPSPGAESAAPAPREKVLLSSLLLLAPWPLLAFAERVFASFINPDSPLWTEIPIWVVNPVLVVVLWWTSCLVLLAPVFKNVGSGKDRTWEQKLEWHRRVTGRLYVAANLLLWFNLALSAFHPVVRDVVEYMIRSVTLAEGSLAARLASVTMLGYLAGVQFLVWKVFARLARGRVEPRSAERGTDGDGESIRERPVTNPAAVASSILWRERYEKAFSFSLLALAGLAFFEIQPYLVSLYHELRMRYSVEWLYFLMVASFLAIVLAAMFLQSLTGVGQKLGLLCLGILGPALPFLVFLTFVDAQVYGERWFELRWLLFGDISLWITWIRISFLAVTVAVAAYLLGKLIDANATGMHGFYRDRLSQGYLVGVDEDGVLGPEKELSLLEICQPGSGAPYHLINTSLNMQGESAGAQRWRNSDFFVFSKHWCGGPYSEYCRTEHLVHLAPNVHLGSAMAVSAAAAAPNMGSYTSGFLVMLMTLLNVRLGLWVPTPRRVRRMARLGLIGPADGIFGRMRRWWLRLKNRPSGYFLVDEMASRLDASGPYVNLSDGGHLENTGAYELLRRRCKFIVIGDAESDPAMHFGSVAALMRYATIDLGVEIEIDLEPLRLREDGTSKGHYAVGTISYPPTPGSTERETGRLLYIKASVDGGESEIIREYRARHPDFPQESTADQVFEEDQFEAYRALGYHIGEGLFAADGAGPLAGHADVGSWFAGLGRSQSGESPAAAEPAPG